MNNDFLNSILKSYSKILEDLTDIKKQLKSDSETRTAVTKLLPVTKQLEIVIKRATFECSKRPLHINKTEIVSMNKLSTIQNPITANMVTKRRPLRATKKKEIVTEIAPTVNNENNKVLKPPGVINLECGEKLQLLNFEPIKNTLLIDLKNNTAVNNDKLNIEKPIEIKVKVVPQRKKRAVNRKIANIPLKNMPVGIKDNVNSYKTASIEPVNSSWYMQIEKESSPRYSKRFILEDEPTKLFNETYFINSPKR